MANHAAASVETPCTVTEASSAVHTWTPPYELVTATGALIRLSSGLRAGSDVTVNVPSELLIVAVEPSPVLVAGTGNAYGSLGVARPVRVGDPWPAVTVAVSWRVQAPIERATGLLSPLARNGKEFTR